MRSIRFIEKAPLDFNDVASMKNNIHQVFLAKGLFSITFRIQETRL